MATLRELLANGLVVAPGVYDAFTARLVEEAGFSAAYLSGAGVSYSLLAQPDVYAGCLERHFVRHLRPFAGLTDTNVRVKG